MGVVKTNSLIRVKPITQGQDCIMMGVPLITARAAQIELRHDMTFQHKLCYRIASPYDVPYNGPP